MFTEVSFDVADALRKLGDLYAQRNAIYGDSYHKFGELLETLFPDGLTLHGASDFNRFICYTQALGKLTRYAPNFHKGGHADSLDDNSVYSQMLQQLDFEKEQINEAKENG
jgi:hypothetical protein